MIYIFDLIENITYLVPQEFEGSNIQHEMIIMIRTYNSMFTTEGKFRVKKTSNTSGATILEYWQINKLIQDVKLELELESHEERK